MPSSDKIKLFNVSHLPSHIVHSLSQKQVLLYKPLSIWFGLSSPTPRVDWIRVDAEMPQGRWRQESFGQELVIENIQFEDVGKYECQGINDDTSVPIRRSFDLAIEGDSIAYSISLNS